MLRNVPKIMLNAIHDPVAAKMADEMMQYPQHNITKT